MIHLKCNFQYGKIQFEFPLRFKNVFNICVPNHDRLPFDWKNPFGFIIAIVLESIGIWFGVSFTACLVTFGIGSYLFEITFTKIIKRSLRNINHSAKKKKSKIELMKQLSDYIEHQTAEKR